MKYPFLTYAFHKFAGEWMFWVRIYGYGICITNQKPLFSERHRIEKSLRICGIKLEVLKP